MIDRIRLAIKTMPRMYLVLFFEIRTKPQALAPLKIISTYKTKWKKTDLTGIDC